MKGAHQFIAFWATAATIVSTIVNDPTIYPARAQAQDWPTRPMTLVVPFSAGGSSDAVARIVADGISSNLRQPVVVENVTGVGGLLGGNRVARSTPDGYQFVIGNVGTFAQSQWLYKQPLYNAVTDFAPVALLTDESLVLVARKDFPADNLQQFIAYAKANQDKLHYASSGVGGSNHLAYMMLNSAIGVDVTHVPYRNVVQGLQDVMAGRMDYDCPSLPLALPQVAANSVKPIAILSKNRSSILPELRSADEQGLTGFDVPSWYALFLPAATPPAIVQKLNRATPWLRSKCRPFNIVSNRSGATSLQRNAARQSIWHNSLPPRSKNGKARSKRAEFRSDGRQITRSIMLRKDEL
jgi:tripartite-type tricarboxylate transporter receptor subunit TctC